MTEGLPFKILIVEDDADDRFFIDDAFREIGYNQEVKKMINGDYLLHYLELTVPELYPNLIILDNSLPKWDAYELLKVIKKDERYAGIRVIVYSTSMSPGLKNKLIEGGAYGCYQKPATRREIVQMVQEFKAISEDVSTNHKFA